ncbi:MAG: hypothetical protein MMC23_003731 [Stictis urceolatum]|nr:hypothetical protein [Stictis urceolata]
MISLFARFRSYVLSKLGSPSKTTKALSSASRPTCEPTTTKAIANPVTTPLLNESSSAQESSVRADTAHIFTVGEYDEEYWNTYLSARPKYSPAFYNHIFDYHRSHSSCLEIAHDVGTGPGQVAAVLSEHFTHVYASDNSRSHLAVAAHRLRDLVESEHISLVEGKAEDISNHYPAASADFVAAAECAPLLDRPAAIAAWAKVLRPGGTLAIWFYGRPAFAGEEQRAARCQAAYDRIATIVFGKIIRGLNPLQKAGWARTTVALKSWLDDIELLEDHWKRVERTKWNPDKVMSFYDDAACDFEAEPTSGLQACEKVVELVDRSFWAEEWDIEDVKKFLRVNLPKINEVNGEECEELDSLYRELEQAIGAPGSKIDVTWPVVLILAEKR